MLEIHIFNIFTYCISIISKQNVFHFMICGLTMIIIIILFVVLLHITYITKIFILINIRTINHMVHNIS